MHLNDLYSTFSETVGHKERLISVCLYTCSFLAVADNISGFVFLLMISFCLLSLVSTSIITVLLFLFNSHSISFPLLFLPPHPKWCLSHVFLTGQIVWLLWKNKCKRTYNKTTGSWHQHHNVKGRSEPINARKKIKGVVMIARGCATRTRAHLEIIGGQRRHSVCGVSTDGY